MRVCLTVDVEVDCPPFLRTWRGVEEGLPWLLDALDVEQVPATFFVTGAAARHAPSIIRDIVSAGHELGCHGNEHRDFTRLTLEDARRDVGAACAELRRFGPVSSFRAPFLRLPASHLAAVREADLAVDSSLARYKGLGVRPHREAGVVRVPASVTSSFLRVPAVIRDPVVSRLSDPAVLFVHPWEFVDLSREPIRWDCRYRTGDGARADWRSLIGHLKGKRAQFFRMRDCAIT